MAEINLLDKYPKSKRPIEERGQLITEEHRATARKFGFEYYDGERLTGYGGYNYHPRFWQDTVKRFRDHYNLKPDAKVLDVGCAKGFMMHDFKELMPEITIQGLDISEYGKEHALDDMREFIDIGNAKELPYEDNSFDLVICINTVHNLPLEECKQALQEIQRVTRKDAFVTMDAWRNDREHEQLLKWNLTALTYMHVNDWIALFDEVGYKGDYWWFIAETA
ncbi:class I SAM-dependent methyltransferase [Pseudodesulfovibrio karagichevae]|uniref:Class I SAM-dependent methyltransferase n=1 Tax=Pseudodesulfovibrio karagichevae TaxID=3239305 RepID=A0ABV4JZ18_9BACT